MAGSVRWRACLDPSTSQVYYVDTQSNVSSWDRPSDFLDDATSDGWQPLWDLEQNRSYWYNQKTGESSWSNPSQGRPSLIDKKPTDRKREDTKKSHIDLAAKTHHLPKLHAAMIPIVPLKDDTVTTPGPEAKLEPMPIPAHHNDCDGGSVTAAPMPVQLEQPSNFLQQQLRRRSRATTTAAMPQQTPSASPTEGSTDNDTARPARVVRPARKSMEISTPSKTLNESAPDALPSAVISQAAAVAAPIRRRPGDGRKSTEIKISQVFNSDSVSEASVDAPVPETDVRAAPITFVRPQPSRRSVPNEAVQQTLDPHDRRGITRRSSSSQENEPLPTKVPIVQAPVRKRRPIPVPTSQAPDAPDAVEQPSADLDRDKDQRMLEQVVTEIVSSERSYVQSLQTMVEVFIERIVHDPAMESVMEDARVAMFFSNAEQVASLNTTLLSELENVVAADGPLRAPSAIGSLFLRYVKLFSVYTQYARHYGQACEILLAKGDVLENTFRDIQSDPRAQGQSLFSLGIMPIQRIPRYCLLLRELQRKLPQPVQEIDAALTEVEGAAVAINEAIRERESREDMLKAAASSKRGAELLKTGHHLLKTGTLSKIDRNGNLKKYTFMLFADQLRYGNRSISLDGCTIERDPFQLKKRGLHGWVVRTPERSFMVCADNGAAAGEWIQAIEAEIVKYQSAGTTAALAPVKTNSDFCSVCATRFTMLHRARYCDLCGKSVCQNCYSKVRRNGPKLLRACHFCRHVDDEDVVDGAASKSATMTDMGSTCNDEDSMALFDEPIQAVSHVVRDPIRNHLAAALEELKLKVSVIETTTPDSELAEPAAPEPAPPAPEPSRRSTRGALDHLAAKINEVRSRSDSHSEPEPVVVDTRARQDLMADVRNWMQHHRKPSGSGGGSRNTDADAPVEDRPVVSVVQIQTGTGMTAQGPIASLDQATTRIIDLETAFLQQLGEVERVFARPLLDDMTCAALPSSLAIVFDTISNLQAIHSKLCSSLSEGGGLLQALLTFSELARRPYLVYARHYGESIRDLEDPDQQARINLCAKVAGISSGAVMVLLKHLARPMQRLPLYIAHSERIRDLLEQQQTEASAGPDLETLTKALANFHQTWKRLSEIVELRASFETLKSIEEQFDAGGSSAVHLAIPSRVFVRWGMLDKYDRRGKCEHLAFHLFSDVLIYSEKVTTGFRLRRQIPLQQCQLIRDDERAKHEHSFQLRLVGSSKSLIIAALSDIARHEWISMINNCIARVLVRKSFSNTDSGSRSGAQAFSRNDANDVEMSFDQSQGPATQGSMNSPETWNEAETWNDAQSVAGGGNAGAERYAMFFEESSENDPISRSMVESIDVEKHPREVASLWTLYLTDQGDEYFHDSVTGRTTWTRPSTFAVIPQS